MYIKLKNIKRFLLIISCIMLAGFNYFSYAKADDANNADLGVCDKTIDSDCDGLINTEEKLYGTDLNNTDTDRDGYSDGVEIKSGFDPLKPAPEDRIASNNVNVSTTSDRTSNDASQTTAFSQDLASFIQSKNGSVSVTDMNTFVNEQLEKTMSESASVSFDTLPEIDRSQIKILDQDYPDLSEKKRKEEIKNDATKYLQKMGYLLINNAPTPILSADDYATFQEEFSSHLVGLSGSETSAADLNYFADLGNRVEIFLSQAATIEVPETMLEMHIKFLRLAKGLLTIGDFSQTSFNDPMVQVSVSTKISAYAKMYVDFFQSDFQNYFDNLD